MSKFLFYLQYCWNEHWIQIVESHHFYFAVAAYVCLECILHLTLWICYWDNIGREPLGSRHDIVIVVEEYFLKKMLTLHCFCLNIVDWAIFSIRENITQQQWILVLKMFLERIYIHWCNHCLFHHLVIKCFLFHPFKFC